ncbi:hypothetical protein U9M48_010047 [Paspalum notatum var. saurae]|uniref:Uncharacterized protein n=1 Tax=Paspalum notatum var. saurae TaxID=547442 RepID=A0AAQ3SS98_PASNO
MVWRFRLSSVPVPSTTCSDFPSPVPFPWFPVGCLTWNLLVRFQPCAAFVYQCMVVFFVDSVPWFYPPLQERRGLPALSSRRAALAAHSFVLLPVVLSVWCCVKAEGKVAVSSHRGLAFRGILGVEQFQDRAAHSCKQDSDALLFESWQGLLAYSPPQMLDDMLNVVVMEMGMPGFEQKRPFIVPDGIMMFTVSPCWTTVLGIT